MGSVWIFRMPFGLSNAPATFQQTLELILKEFSYKCGIPYLDDIIIFSPTIEQHRIDVIAVFNKLNDVGLKLNKRKCKFFWEWIRILGRVVSKGVIKADDEKVKWNRDANLPQRIDNLRGFLGVLNYLRDSIPNLAKEAADLYDLLKREEKNLKRS